MRCSSSPPPAFLQVASGHDGAALGLALFAASAWFMLYLLERLDARVPSWIAAAIPGAVVAVLILLLAMPR